MKAAWKAEAAVAIAAEPFSHEESPEVIRGFFISVVPFRFEIVAPIYQHRDNIRILFRYEYDKLDASAQTHRLNPRAAIRTERIASPTTRLMHHAWQLHARALQERQEHPFLQ